MKTKFKYLIVIFLSLLTICILQNKAYATNWGEEKEYGTDIKYRTTENYNTTKEKGAEITWINKNVTNITIPSNINGYPVREIEMYACMDSKYLQNISLPDTLKCIDNDAFKGCSALKSIVIPDSVEEMGNWISYGIFGECTSLTDVKLPKNIKEISDDMFVNCTSLRSIVIPEKVEKLSTNAFNGCTSLTSVQLPNSLKRIDTSCFKNCSSLVEFNMPDSVTEFGGRDYFAGTSVFSGCTKLKKIKLSNNLTEIPEDTFKNCSSLQELYIPESVKEIGDAFVGCTNLKKMNIPPHATYYNGNFFEETQIKEIIHPTEYKDVGNIGNWLCDEYNGITFIFPRTIQRMKGFSGDEYKNCVVWGFSDTPVKDEALEKNITFKELPLLTYSTHVENIGDQMPVTNGVMAGTSGQGFRLESIKINLDLSKTGYTGGIKYSTHIQNIGWQSEVSNGNMSGTTGQGLRLEAIKISLTGQVANYFDIYYRVHAQNVGWLDWAKNGQEAGTAGYGYRLEGIEILVLPKTLKYAPGLTTTPYLSKIVIKTAEISEKNITLYNKGETRNLTANFSIDGRKITDIVWTSSNSNVATVSNTGKVTAVGNGTTTIKATSPSTGLEATCNVKVSITVAVGGDYKKGDYNNDGVVNSKDVSYFLDVKNRPSARDIQIFDMDADGVLTDNDYNILNNFYMKGAPTIEYITHIQNHGWRNYVKNGERSGTVGEGLRLEGIKIRLTSPISGGIQYRTHIENIGWEETYKSSDEFSGTEGQGLRLEAIQIRLTGNMEKLYDIYYRVHAENVGWLDWARNGQEAGTAKYGFRLEAIEIKLVEKGNSAPGKTDTPFMENN